MFTGGLGFQYGAERLGMLTVPAAAGNTKRQLKFISDFGTTALHAIPSYAARMYEIMQEMGIDPRRDTKLRTLIIGAEPHSEEPVSYTHLTVIPLIPHIPPPFVQQAPVYTTLSKQHNQPIPRCV